MLEKKIKFKLGVSLDIQQLGSLNGKTFMYKDKRMMHVD